MLTEESIHLALVHTSGIHLLHINLLYADDIVLIDDVTININCIVLKNIEKNRNY